MGTPRLVGVNAMGAGYCRHAFVGQFLALGANALLAGTQSSEVVRGLGDNCYWY